MKPKYETVPNKKHAQTATNSSNVKDKFSLVYDYLPHHANTDP